jgi:sugar phosphate isomerase/epimerase
MTTDEITNPPRLGATIFSFTREYVKREWSLVECMRAVASLGDGQHLEILDSQHISSYPSLSPEAEREFRDAVDASGVRLTVYGHEVEHGWIAGRPFDADTLVDHVVDAMRIASRLGFRMFRANMPSPALLQRLLPHADDLGLDLVVELHSHTIESPDIQELLAAFDTWNSPRVGFLQDLGAFTTTVPRAFLNYKAATGVPLEILAVVDEGYREGRSKQDVLAEVRALGGDALAIETANECFAMFVRTAPETLSSLGPYLRHVHTKFYEMIDGEEPCIPYPEIISRLKGMGYEGVLSSEWTGFNFIERPVALDQIRDQQSMVSRLWRDAPQFATR